MSLSYDLHFKWYVSRTLSLTKVAPTFLVTSRGKTAVVKPTSCNIWATNKICPFHFKYHSNCIFAMAHDAVMIDMIYLISSDFENSFRVKL